MATTPVIVPVEEYLHTVYRPDCDYVDGEVLERNMGEKPHARLQKFLLRFLEAFEEEANVEALPEQRLQINSSRFRIPDIMLVSADDPEPKIVRQPPLLCIEILSSEDRMRKVEERINDYATLGVQSMWVIDPWRRVTYAAGPDGVLREVLDRLVVTKTSIAISPDDIFAELDRLEKRSAGPSSL